MTDGTETLNQNCLTAHALPHHQQSAQTSPYCYLLSDTRRGTAFDQGREAGVLNRLLSVTMLSVASGSYYKLKLEIITMIISQNEENGHKLCF